MSLCGDGDEAYLLQPFFRLEEAMVLATKELTTK